MRRTRATEKRATAPGKRARATGGRHAQGRAGAGREHTAPGAVPSDYPVLTPGRLRRLYWALAVATVGVSTGLTLPVADQLPGSFLVLCAVFIATIAVGELWRVPIAQARDLAPLSLSAALAAPLIAEVDIDAPISPTAGPIVLSVAIGSVAGSYLVQVTSGVRVNWNATTVRMIAVGFAVVMFRVVAPDGRSLATWKGTLDGRLWMIAVLMLIVAVAAMCLHVVLSSLERAVRTHARLWSVISHEGADLAPLAIAVTSTAVVIPFAIRAVGPIAVPLFLIPLGLMRLAAVRQSGVTLAQRQTIHALSQLTDHGGLTVPGHAARVGRLAIRVGRELGLSERDLVDLEYAGMLHDLGQVGLRRPIPGGATSQTAPLDQRHIAATGASILARTEQLSRLARVVADQATPYHRAQETGSENLPAAILRVANAFDDLGRAASETTGVPDDGTAVSGDRVVMALERIRLGVGHDYDPAVVAALCRVLVREGHLPTSALGRYGGRAG